MMSRVVKRQFMDSEGRSVRRVTEESRRPCSMWAQTREYKMVVCFTECLSDRHHFTECSPVDHCVRRHPYTFTVLERIITMQIPNPYCQYTI